MTTFYYYSVNHQSALQRNTFSKLSYAANYVISFKLRYQRVMPQKGIEEKQVEGFCSFRLSIYIFVPPT